MQLIIVSTPEHEKEFIELNASLQKNNPYYIRPLDKEVKDAFSATKNKHLHEGKVIRWIIVKEGITVGRIAAFMVKKYVNKGTDYTTGCIGFFDAINNQAVANLLFDESKKWLLANGAEAMDGPVNIGDRDKWWGLMVAGFDKEPVYGMAYNPPYYQQLFETYGFKNYYNQYYYTMEIDRPFSEKIQQRHAKIKSKAGYTARHIQLNEIEKYAGDFATVYNQAWAQHGEAKEVSKDDILAIFKQLKPIMDERLIWFAYYKEEPIAMFINVPDINQYFRHFNGKLGLLQKLQLMYYKYTAHCKKATGLAFGVIPKYQALGIDSFIIQECGNLIQNKGWYSEYEMGWCGDWNPIMLNIYKSLNGVETRHLITYRLIFDEEKNPFLRHPPMEYK